MVKQLFILSLAVFLCSDLYALEKSDCSPALKGRITDSKITLNCSKKLPVGVKQKLEDLLNEKFSGNENDECSPHFQGEIKEAEITIRCGYPLENIQKIIDDFLVNFVELKDKLADLKVTEAETKELQEQADQAIDAGEFDQAQALIDQIITAEESVGQKALERILASREVYKNSQIDLAQAHIDTGSVAISQFECEEAISHFEMSAEVIEKLNTNSLEPSSELMIDKSLLAAKVEACQQARISNDVPLNGTTEAIELEFNEIETSATGEQEQ